MPKIISTFSGESPLASTIANFGKSMWGNSTENALNSEKLYAAQRANAELDNYAKLVADQGMQNLGANKLAQAMIIASGYDPADASRLGLMGAATDFGAKDPRTQNWQIASGQGYDNTAAAFDARLAETARANTLASSDRRYDTDTTAKTERYKWGNLSADQSADNAEAIRNNNLQSGDRRYSVDQSQLTERTKPFAVYDPVTKQTDLMPTNEVNNANVRPIISEADQKGLLLGDNWNNLDKLLPSQREVLGANVDGAKTSAPKNYILPGGKTIITYDGITDPRTGQVLPPGGCIGTVQGSATDAGVTNAVKTDVQSNLIANQKFNMLADMGIELTNDPNLFGAQGYARSLAQEAAMGVQGVASLFQDGQQGKLALDEARQDLANNGLTNLIPELYNPDLPKVETIWGLLLYQGASALAGQENRSVSDKDVQAMRQILGSPQSLFTSAEAMRSKLQTAKEIIAQNAAIDERALNGDLKAVAPTQIKDADDYNALPPGTKYIDPNGVERTKGAR